MPRGKPIEAQQLDDVVRAAARVFARLGYRRARMTDVAAEAGLSPGALYTYVEGKDALFHLVVVGTDPSPSLPVPNPPAEETIAAVDRRLRARVPVGAMRRAAEESTTVEPAAELRELLGDLYDAVADDRQFLSVIERSASDVPGLAERYYRQGRRGYVHYFAAYLRRRADEGRLRAVPDADVTARYLIETVAWFAWHRHDDNDSSMINDEVARQTVLDMGVAALAREVDQ
jgi:AcrR family transcriptional regulator